MKLIQTREGQLVNPYLIQLYDLTHDAEQKYWWWDFYVSTGQIYHSRKFETKDTGEEWLDDMLKDA